MASKRSVANAGRIVAGSSGRPEPKTLANDDRPDRATDIGEKQQQQQDRMGRIYRILQQVCSRRCWR